MKLRPEVRALLSNGVLRQERSDHDWALQLVQQAEEYLESAHADRDADRNLAAIDGYYQAIWDSLRAMLADLGLSIARGRGEDGKHVATMQFGEAELRDTKEEMEAGVQLEPIRQQRNQNHYRHASRRLGLIPKVAQRVVDAARRRVPND